MYGWFLLCNVAAPKNSKAAGRSFFDIVDLIDFLYDRCNFVYFWWLSLLSVEHVTFVVVKPVVGIVVIVLF